MKRWLALALLLVVVGVLACGSDPLTRKPALTVAVATSPRTPTDVAQALAPTVQRLEGPPSPMPTTPPAATPLPISSGPALVQVAPPPVAPRAPSVIQQVTIRAGENEGFYFTPNDVRLTAGTVQVRFINEGLRAHTFNIKDANWRDVFNYGTVDSGTEASFAFTLSEPGSYTFYCILYKHVDFGQTGQLTISR